MSIQSKNYGKSGLRNLGNTCYLNAVLQCLAHTNVLCVFFLKKQFFYNLKKNSFIKIKKKLNKETLHISNAHFIMDDMKNSFTFLLYNLFKTYWSENCVVRPITLKSKIDSELTLSKNFSQNCSHDLLVQLFDKINEETKEIVDISLNNIPMGVIEYKQTMNKLKKELELANNDNDKEIIMKKIVEYETENFIGKFYVNAYNDWNEYIGKDFSIIKENFSWHVCQFIQCHECKYSSIKFDKGNVMTLPFPETDSCSLYDMFKQEFSNETLKDNNAYMCEKCNKLVNATLTKSIWYLPDILIITLKRFNNNSIKIRKSVTFPVNNLNLKEFHFETRTSYSYDLYGIIEHMGGCNGGHYIAYCKNMDTEEWFKFDDTKVTNVENIMQEINLREYYILFYKKNIDDEFDNMSVESDDDYGCEQEPIIKDLQII